MSNSPSAVRRDDTPIAAMQGPIALSSLFLRFMGVVEVLGGARLYPHASRT
jgi:hypothetical protein